MTPKHLAVFIGTIIAAILLTLGIFFLLHAVSLPQFFSEQSRNQPADSHTQAMDPARISSPFAVSFGQPNAKVTVVEFLDFQCPFCQAASTTLRKLMQDYSGQSVRFEFRQFPLTSIHPYALSAAYAALCANEQGKFLDFYNFDYAHQDQLSDATLETFAQSIGLNLEQYNTCVAQKKYEPIIKADLSDAITLGLQGTPSWFINQTPLAGALPYATFKAAIDRELAK